MKKSTFLHLSFLLLLYFFIPAQIFAGNFAGGNISYRPLDSITYEVTLKIYTDCSSVGNPPGQIKVSWAGGSYTSTASLVKTTDVTGFNNGCPIISKCSGGSSPYGFNEYLFIDTISLDSTDCKVTISWDGAQRSPDITTVSLGSFVYLFAELNKCLGLNNSPYTTQPPQFLAVVGQDLFLSTGYIDTTDGDSLHFSLVNPQSAVGTDIAYMSPWSSRQPVTFLGFPNANLNNPAGFHFDSITSQINFRPTLQNQHTVYVIQVREFRKINGNMQEIGRTRYEQNLVIISSPNNKIPTIQANPGTVCAGKQICFTITTADADANDTTQLTWNSSLENASFVVDNTKRLKTATLCWTPAQDDTRNWPHLVTINITDNACGNSSRTLALYVKPPVDSIYKTIASKDVSCSRLRIKMQTPAPAAIVRNFFVPNGNSFFTAASKDSAEIYFTQSGWNRFGIRVMQNCADTVWDSVFVQPPYQLQLLVSDDTTVCPSDSFTLSITPLNGTAPYKYNWFPLAGTGSTFKFAAFGNITFRPRVIDSIGCVASDSVKITVHKVQTARFTYKDTVCNNEQPFAITANPPGGTWTGPGIVAGQFDPPSANIGRNVVQYTFSDSNSCTVKQTTPVFVVAAPQPQFTANITVGQKPLTVIFSNLTTSTPVVSKWLWQFINSATGDKDTTSVQNPTHIFNDTGRYDVILTAISGRCATSEAKLKYITVGPLMGIGTLQDNVLKAYPNPASHVITLEAPGKIQEVILTDMLGRNQSFAINSANEVSLGQVSEGLYVLQAIDAIGISYFTKVLVQR